MIGYCTSQLKRLWRSEHGNVLMLVGLAGFMMITATGVSVDMARAQILQAKIQVALDAAGLAAGATAGEVPSGNDSSGNPWTTASWVQYQATRYFSVNFPSGYLASVPITPTATLSDNNQIISLSASTTQSTTFLKAVGITTVAVGTSSQITRSNAGMELVLVMDNTGSMNSPVNPSDSSTPKITAAKSAATTLVNILYGSNTTVTNLWIGLVPFSQAVNMGTGDSGWMNSSFDSGLDFGPTTSGSGGSTTCQTYTGTTPSTAGTYSGGNWWSSPSCSYTLSGSAIPSFGMSSNWLGCVLSRSGTATDTTSGLTYDIADAPPSGTDSNSTFDAYDFPPDGYYNSVWESSSSGGTRSNPTETTSYTEALNTLSYGPNYLCPQQITTMTASKTTILNGISAMSAGGSTFINIGMAWGWRLISPRWTGTWPGEMYSTGNTQFPQLPLPYNTTLMNKVVVLMTDGMNEYDSGNYTTYGYLSSGNLGTTTSIYSGASYSGSAEQQLDTRTLAVCTALKNNGVIIYTIGFGQNGNDNANDQYSVNGPLLQSCASNPSFYFLAPTNSQLQTIFEQIGDSLANLRVSQ